MWDQIVNNFITAPAVQTKPTESTHKTCRDCGETKPHSEFYERNSGAKNTSRCKPCYMLNNKKYKTKKENSDGKGCDTL